MTAVNKNGGGIVVGKGEYYKAGSGKDKGQLVCVFFADLSEVAYAPVGSSKEFRTDQETFLETYERVELEDLEKEEAPAKEAPSKK